MNYEMLSGESGSCLVQVTTSENFIICGGEGCQGVRCKWCLSSPPTSHYLTVRSRGHRNSSHLPQWHVNGTLPSLFYRQIEIQFSFFISFGHFNL